MKGAPQIRYFYSLWTMQTIYCRQKTEKTYTIHKIHYTKYHNTKPTPSYDKSHLQHEPTFEMNYSTITLFYRREKNVFEGFVKQTNLNDALYMSIISMDSQIDFEINHFVIYWIGWKYMSAI